MESLGNQEDPEHLERLGDQAIKGIKEQGEMLVDQDFRDYLGVCSVYCNCWRGWGPGNKVSDGETYSGAELTS